MEFYELLHLLMKLYFMFVNLFCISKTSSRQIVLYSILLTLFFSFISAEAQNLKPGSSTAKSSKTVEPEFKNTGEQEDYWAKELFTRDYNKQQYERYKGSIIVNGGTYHYNDIVLTVCTMPEFKEIFQKGIFYPSIIAESFKYRPKIKIRMVNDSSLIGQKTDTTKSIQKSSDILVRTDSLTITNLEELKFSSSTPKQRSFRFWLQGHYPIENPVVYFMELTNENATVSTDIITFINGSKLTFFEEGWLII